MNFQVIEQQSEALSDQSVWDIVDCVLKEVLSSEVDGQMANASSEDHFVKDREMDPGGAEPDSVVSSFSVFVFKFYDMFSCSCINI